MADKQPNTKWHQFFGFLLQKLLTPLGLIVQTELQVTSESPKIDVIIIKRTETDWTPQQRNFLPDAIRDSHASHILLVFKYTESFNLQAVRQILSYEYFYREAQKLGADEVDSFLVISKTPHAKRLREFGYHQTDLKGIYESDNIILKEIPTLVLNKLSNEPYNVYFKLFASKQMAKQEAVTILEEKPQIHPRSGFLRSYINGLLSYRFVMQGDDVMFDLTPEQMVEASKMFKNFILPRLTLSERLDYMSWEDVTEEELRKIPIVYRFEERGIEQGIEKGKLESLKQIIALRFKNDLSQFEDKLTQLNLTTLNKLTEVALTVEQLADFETVLAETFSKRDNS